MQVVQNLLKIEKKKRLFGTTHGIKTSVFEDRLFQKLNLHPGGASTVGRKEQITVRCYFMLDST